MIIRFIIKSLRKHLFLNLTKIVGLGLAFSGILLIVLFLYQEFHFDSFHKKADQIYRFTITSPKFLSNKHFARIYDAEQIPEMVSRFPEIENYVRLAPIRGGVLKFDNEYFKVSQAFTVDTSFFDVFDVQLKIGNKGTVLKNPGSVVISERFCEKVFGNRNPIGQILTRPAGQYYETQTDYTITGVMRDLPYNSHFHPEVIVSSPSGNISWWAYCYFMLKESSKPENIIQSYPDYISEITDLPQDTIQITAHLQKLTEIHLHSDKLREIESNGNLTYLYVLIFAALFLLLIAMSNYASLNLGMSDFSQKFITVSRIVGASQKNRIVYYIFDSFITIGLSLGLTIFFSILVNHNIIKYFNIDLFNGNGFLIFVTLTLLSLTGILSGILPFVIVKLRQVNGPSSTLLNTGNMRVSKSFIVFQYSLSIILIISVFVISRQTNFALENSMGTNIDSIICFEEVHSSVQQKFETFKSELLKHQSIKSVSAMLEPPGGEANDMFSFEMQGMTEQNNDESSNFIGVFPCDYSFPKVFNLEFLSGQDFSEHNTDIEGSGEYIINESAMYYLNYSNPNDIIGKRFQLKSSVPIPKGKIIGVVQDFHLSSIKKKVQPLVLFKRENMWMLNFVIAFYDGKSNEAISDIQKVWSQLFPAYPLDYQFVDTMYEKVYQTELMQSALTLIFTIVSLFICSIGLLGLSLIFAQKRTKEIAIRKVNGATISKILYLLNIDFIKWIAMAFVIAVPVAYYAMKKWLQNFAYKIELSWWIFVLAGLIVLLIALITVSWQSLKAARRNPVESLKYE